MNSTSPLQSPTYNFPVWGRGIFAVWYRNLLYFKYTLFSSFFIVIIEPLLIFLAIGYGLGFFIGDLDGTPYRSFFFPALVANASMFISFFEASYGSYAKLTQQRTFESILMTPIETSEIVLGEILWASSKGLMCSLVIAGVGAGLGLIESWLVLPSLLVVFLLCWSSASFGMLLASSATKYDIFIYAQCGLLIPLSLFSHTFFPITHYPETLQLIVFLFPLSHAVSAVRALLAGDIPAIIFLNLGVLFGYGFILSQWAVYKMSKRIYE
ncbi:MAG: ABC transporter permease [Bdellovibrionales bacterium]|nr:ABC transporter permease [Bdellovibrionales bacterium]